MRRRYLDNIRFSVVILVVIYHVFYMYNAEGVEGGPGPFWATEPSKYSQPWDIVQYMLYPWFMMILFLISGISSRLYLDGRSEKEYLKSRTRKLLVPSTVGVLLFGWIQGWVNMSLLGVFETIPAETPKPVMFLIMTLSGTGVLWFLHLLWFFSLTLYFLRKFEKGKLYRLAGKLPFLGVVSLGVVLWLFAQVLNAPVIICYRFGVYGAAFFLGYYVFARQEIVDKLSRYWTTLAVACVAFFIPYCNEYFGENFAADPAFISPLSVGFAWLAILTILGVSNKYFNFENAVTTWLKNRSFGLYVFHYLGISALALVASRCCANLPVILVYVLTGAAGFAVGYGLNAIVSRTPFLRWALLGVKAEK